MCTSAPLFTSVVGDMGRWSSAEVDKIRVTLFYFGVVYFAAKVSGPTQVQKAALGGYI